MSDTIRYKSNEADGATAIAHELDTKNSLVTGGAKILSIKRAGVEKFAVDKDGVVQAQSSVIVVRPDEGGNAIWDAMVVARNNGGGIVQLLAGTYNVTEAASVHIVNFGSFMSNVTLQGVGDATVLNWTGSSGSPLILNSQGSGPSNSKLLQTASQGDTSVFTVTASEAGAYDAGAYVLIRGVDPNETLPSVSSRREINKVKTTGNPGTGEIELEWPLLNDITADGNTNITEFFGGINNTVRDLKIVDNGTANGGSFISLFAQVGCVIENVTVVGQQDGVGARLTAGIDIGACVQGEIRNCKATDMPGRGFQMSDAHASSITDCKVVNVAYDAATTSHVKGGIVPFTTYACVISGNYIENSTVNGIQHAPGSGAFSRNLRVEGNVIKNCVGHAINNTNVFGGVISFNVLESAANGIEMGGNTGAKRMIFQGNIIRNMSGVGINAQGIQDSIIQGNVLENVGFGISISSAPLAGNGENNTVNGNVVNGITSVSAFGIAVNNQGNVSVTGNVIDDQQDAAGEGLELNGNADNGLAAGNVIQNCAGPGIRILGTGPNPADNWVVVGNNAEGEGITQGPSFGTGNILGLNKE